MKNLIILLSIIFPSLLFAQLVNDLKVNLDTNLSVPKYYSSVSSNIKGNTVVTWEVRGNSDVNVFAQIFDSSFNRVGNNFRINSIPDLSSTSDVAVRKDGSFGIAWNSITVNPYRSKIVLKIYDKNGLPISGEIQLSDSSKSFEPNIKIGTDSSNRFIITFDYPNPSSSSPDIFYQIVDSNGVKIGNNIKVNQIVSFGKPALAVKKDGGFIITWEGSLGSFPPDIYCQLFSPNGTPIGGNKQVNNIEIDPLDDQQLPDVAVDSAGNFTVGFKETPYSSGVARIKYQRFDKNGNKIGINKIINNAFYVFQFSSDEEGNLIFLLSFNGSGSGLYNLRIDKNDNPIGTYYSASNQFPNVPMTGNDIVFVNKKYINLWRDTRLGGQPQVYLNVRSYANPDSVVFVNIINTEIPPSFSLSQNYPNPFNPSTTIKFAIPNTTAVKITIYDITGKEMEVIVNEKLQAGTYQTNWSGQSFSSGVYFFKIQAGDFVMTKRMVLIK